MKQLAAALGLMASIFSGPGVGAREINAGQWEILASHVTQQICLVSDGTWYGTTFNWNGYWMPDGEKNKGILYGNYAINGYGFGFGNDTMTVLGGSNSLFISWEDWFDDNSYAEFEGGEAFTKIKQNCDRPYEGENTTAASQSPLR